ncbi:hypothetical protein GUJ93_ZPchr0002g26167 [Zizania palustris]|uniref:Uncharacterized protein n=1 Tax=Zizania palustris TaxID=103762 RepID=A0A8J5V3Y2_ZIZPA|nr:hypothetical protein GUJ93_ZPchr0002g26167 [Zizania palustris]
MPDSPACDGAEEDRLRRAPRRGGVRLRGRGLRVPRRCATSAASPSSPTASWPCAPALACSLPWASAWVRAAWTPPMGSAGGGRSKSPKT